MAAPPCQRKRPHPRNRLRNRNVVVDRFCGQRCSLVLGGGGVAAMMLLQLGPFEQSERNQTSTRAKPKPKPKNSAVAQTDKKQPAQNKESVTARTQEPEKQPAVDAKTNKTEQSDENIARDTSKVTLAEVAGYRAQIAQLETRQDTLSSEDRRVFCCMLSTLDYPENVQWVKAAADQAKKLDPKAKQTNIQAALLAARGY